MVANVKSTRAGFTTDFIRSKNDGRTASFYGDPVLDSLVHTVIALGTELWATKRRSKIVEALMNKGQTVNTASIEAYVPTPEEEKSWSAERDALIKTTYGSFANAAIPTSQKAK